MKKFLKALEDLNKIIQEARSNTSFIITNSKEEEDKILEEKEKSFNEITIIILRLW